MTKVGVVGAGTMGAGIAQISALGGYETHLYEIDSKALERGVEMLRSGLRRGAERGPLERDRGRRGPRAARAATP